MYGIGARHSFGISETITSTPLQTWDHIKAVSAKFISLFLDRDGVLWGTGDNFFDQLGNYNPLSVNVPVEVDFGVIAMDAGFGHTLYVTSDGTLWGLGLNEDGQLGIANTEIQGEPVEIDSAVTAVSGGGGHSC